MGEMKSAYKVFVGKPKKKGTLGRIGVDWGIILKSILNIKSVSMCSASIWLNIETMVKTVMNLRVA
jgi:hypothetical protein